MKQQKKYTSVRSSKHRALAAALFLAAQAAPLHAQQALTLHDAIRIGIAQAPESHLSGDQVELQRAQIAQAKLRPNPLVYLTADDLRPWADSFSFPNSTEDYGYFINTFETAGKRGKRIAYATNGLSRSETEHRLQLGLIAAGIADAYWAAEAARQAALEWRQQLAGFDRIVQYQSDRVASGATAGVDLLRTQIERDRIALSSAQAERVAEAANIELARRIASPSLQSAQLTDPLEQERSVPELPIATVLDQRPDIVAARQAIAQARADLRLQHANGVPNLDLIAGYKRNVGFNTIYSGLQFNLPIYNRNQGGIATAHANDQLAQDQLAYTQLTAVSQVHTALSDYRREQALVRGTLPGMADRATRNAAIISDAYRTGGTDLLRYLDAQRVLIDTRLLAIQTWAEYQRAVIALKLAYGEQL